MVNLAFWVLMLVVCICYGYYPNWMWLQLIYYMVCILALSLSLGLLLSAVMPFIPDVGQIVSIFMQLMFWATPIFWNKSLLTGDMVLIYKLNPFSYIITGFRDSVIDHTPILQHYNQTIFFWALVAFLFWFGNKTFNQLRPHFADVL